MEFLKPHWYLIYLALVISLLGLAGSKLLGWLVEATQRRKTMVEDRRRFEAVQSETPVDNPEEIAKSRALERIDQQFTVTKRVLVPILIGLTALLAVMPLLAEAPGAIVSVFIAALTVVGGVAVRPFLENAIAGLVISSSKLINIGDTVLIGDIYGTVEDVSATHTTIKIWDWRRLLLPNSQMIQKEFINFSLIDRFQWAYVEFWVSTDANLEEVERIAIEAPKQSTHFAGHEEPQFWVMDLGKEATKCWVAAWANTPSDAWGLKSDIRRRLFRELKEAGIKSHSFRISQIASNA